MVKSSVQVNKIVFCNFNQTRYTDKIRSIINGGCKQEMKTIQ